MKPVREGDGRSRRKLGLASDLKAEDLPDRTRHPRVQVQSAPVETTAPELPRALEKAVVVTPVARPFVILPTPAVNSAELDNETMAAIGQGVVVEAPCVVLEVVAEEQVLGGHSKCPSCSCSCRTCSSGGLGSGGCYCSSCCWQYDCQ